MKEILVVRLSSLGDIILSYPFLKVLKKYYPETNITFLTKSEYIPVVEMNPHVNNILRYSPDMQFDNFDMIFDLQNNYKSNLLVKGKSKNIYNYKKGNWKKFLLVRFKINLYKTIIPVYQRYIETLSNEIKLTSEDKKFTISELIYPKSNPIQEKYIVVAPSAKHFTKRYPKEKFVELLSPLSSKYKFVLIGSKSAEDMEICNYINSNIANSINICGLVTIPELTTYLNFSEFVISNDSAIMHLSETIGKKVFAIFGSSVKEFGFYPQLDSSIVYEVNDLKCRPCSHIGRSSCPEGHFKCMLDNPVLINLNNKLSTQ